MSQTRNEAEAALVAGRTRSKSQLEKEKLPEKTSEGEKEKEKRVEEEEKQSEEPSVSFRRVIAIEEESHWQKSKGTSITVVTAAIGILAKFGGEREENPMALSQGLMNLIQIIEHTREGEGFIARILAQEGIGKAMNGKALSWFKSVEGKYRSAGGWDVSAFVQAFMKEYVTSESVQAVFRRKITTAKLGEKDPRELRNDLRSWNEFVNLSEKDLLVAFKDALNPRLRDRIDDIKDFEMAVETAEKSWITIEAAEKSKGHVAAISEDKEPERPQFRCFNCDKVGHLARDCRSIQCWNCKRRGHRAADCKEPKKDVFGDNKKDK